MLWVEGESVSAFGLPPASGIARGRLTTPDYSWNYYDPMTIVPRRLWTGSEMVIPFMMLAVESNGVIALRMMKLALGGSAARHEAHLMISEKLDAAFEAAANLMAGASGDEVIQRYRQHVAANARRLAGRLDVPS